MSYCSATIRVNTASVIAMNGTGYGTSNTGNATCSAAVDDRPRHLVVGEPESEPEPREAGVGQALDVCALLRRRRAHAHPGREQQFPALQPRRRILELAHVDPPDRPITSGPRRRPDAAPCPGSRGCRVRSPPWRDCTGRPVMCRSDATIAHGGVDGSYNRDGPRASGSKLAKVAWTDDTRSAVTIASDAEEEDTRWTSRRSARS